MKHIQKKFSLDNFLKTFAAIHFLCIAANVHGQTFQCDNAGIVVDKVQTDIVPAFFFIGVEGLPFTDDGFGIEKVCFHIKHKRPTDLKIELLSPKGTSVWLSNRNGIDNTYGYFNTCVTQNGFNGPIHNPSRLFQGEYTSEGRLDFFNKGEDPNGTWVLIITDLKQGTLGKLEEASITFGNNPAIYTSSKCEVSDVQACFSSDPQNRLIPNLIVSKKLTEDNITYFDNDDPEYPNQLRFAAAMANIGEGPLQIITTNNWYCNQEVVPQDSKCVDGSRPTNNVQQVMFKKGPTGDMEYDTLKSGVMFFDDSPGHNHYHVKNWASFKVLKKRWWTGNPKKWKEIATSDKVSYCLFDNKICTQENGYCEIDQHIYGSKNLPNYGLGNFTSCNGKVQGISVGGIDYYGMFYEGQHIDLPKDISKGDYYLFIEVDPANEYLEMNEEDNYILIPFRI